MSLLVLVAAATGVAVALQNEIHEAARGIRRDREAVETVQELPAASAKQETAAAGAARIT